jgi:hypothetical protein
MMGFRLAATSRQLQRICQLRQIGIKQLPGASTRGIKLVVSALPPACLAQADIAVLQN